MTASGPTRTVDGRGTHISNDLLVILVENLSELAVGDTLELLTEDFPAIDTDLRSWSSVTGHDIVASSPIGGGLRFVVRKGPPLAMAHSLVAVISSDRPSALSGPFGFATAAAVEGLAVSVFFREAAVRLLDRGAGLERPENVPEWSGSLHAEAALPRAFSAGARVRGRSRSTCFGCGAT